METTRAAVLKALVAAKGEASLGYVADAIGLTPSATHRQLALLVEEGLVHRHGRQKDTRYRLASCVRSIWTHAEGDQLLAEEWTHRGPVDWRFPLVTRVPDALARESIIRFLEECAKHGVFTPWLVPYLDRKLAGHDDAWVKLSLKERKRRLGNPANHGGVRVYAYGSCVRGDAHAASDVDILVIHDLPRDGVPSFPYEGVVRDITDTLNLGVPRRLDVRVYGEDAFFDGLVNMYERVRKEILATAITIYSTEREPRFIEAGRARLSQEVDRWTSGRA